MVACCIVFVVCCLLFVVLCLFARCGSRFVVVDVSCVLIVCLLLLIVVVYGLLCVLDNVSFVVCG